MTTIDPAITVEASPLLVGEMSAQSLYDKCWSLARNLWWTWNPQAREVFRRLDYPLWRQTAHNPVLVLRHVSQEMLNLAAADPRFLRSYDAALQALTS